MSTPLLLAERCDQWQNALTGLSGGRKEGPAGLANRVDGLVVNPEARRVPLVRGARVVEEVARTVGGVAGDVKQAVFARAGGARTGTRCVSHRRSRALKNKSQSQARRENDPSHAVLLGT